MASCNPKRIAPAAATAHPSGDVDLDPQFEWHDVATVYVARLHLPGFKKEDFKVQVDAGGSLTVRGKHPAGYVRFHKVFQLPPTANIDNIAGRFDGKVLSLTVPKKPQSAAEMVAAKMAEAECVAAAVVAQEREEAAAIVKGQVFTAAVAGFALGVFVAHRILSTANS